MLILKFRWGAIELVQFDNESHSHLYDFVEKNLDPLNELWLPVAVIIFKI